MSAAPSVVASASPYQIKGYTLRGYIAELARLRMTADVASRVSPAAAELLRVPPPSSAWLDGELLTEIEIAIDAIGGPAAVRKISHDALGHGAIAVLQPLVQGFLRLFGVSPHTLLSRLPKIAAASGRGTEYTYAETGPRSGVLVMSMPHHRNVHMAIFHGMAGATEAVFEACNTRGRVSEPELIEDGKANAARFHVAW